MLRLIQAIEATNKWLGKTVSWCVLIMMMCQVFSVVSRYVFSYGVISIQEVVVYGHALLFMLGSAYLLQINQHVRVDIFYNLFSPEQRRWVDIISLLFFVLPVATVILWVAFPYVARAWGALEGSPQAGGLPAIYLLKSAIIVFAVSFGLQAIATLLRLVFKIPEKHWRIDMEA
ncbi:MAG: TRAP transporter small permease subunit [Pseudomonadota bacterium]